MVSHSQEVLEFISLKLENDLMNSTLPWEWRNYLTTRLVLISIDLRLMLILAW
jgi:hypothetical protein